MDGSGRHPARQYRRSLRVGSSVCRRRGPRRHPRRGTGQDRRVPRRGASASQCSPSAARLAVTGAAAGPQGWSTARIGDPSHPRRDRCSIACRSPPQFAARCAPESRLRPESRGIEHDKSPWRRPQESLPSSDDRTNSLFCSSGVCAAAPMDIQSVAGVSGD